MLLVDRIKALEVEIDFLISKIEDLSKNTEQKHMGPTSIVGGVQNRGLLSPADIETGLGPIIGNGVIWNNGELNTPPANAEAPAPTKGYNKHTHSRYSGGAIIKQNFEIVEYDPTDWVTVPPRNPHSQQFWQTDPQIKKSLNSKNESVDTIGLLDLTFNPDTLKWGVATLEIDIKACQFVQRRTTDGTGGEKVGDIEKDENGIEMKGPLWNEDQTKSSIIWDPDSQVFRLYAAYAPGTPTGV
jgi:hypothetical protein